MYTRRGRGTTIYPAPHAGVASNADKCPDVERISESAAVAIADEAAADVAVTAAAAGAAAAAVVAADAAAAGATAVAAADVAAADTAGAAATADCCNALVWRSNTIIVLFWGEGRGFLALRSYSPLSK